MLRCLAVAQKVFFACVHCDEDPCCKPLKNKIGYAGARRWLRYDHPYRRSKLFNGKTEDRGPPRKYTSAEVDEKVERVKDYEPGKIQHIGRESVQLKVNLPGT